MDTGENAQTVDVSIASDTPLISPFTAVTRVQIPSGTPTKQSTYAKSAKRGICPGTCGGLSFLVLLLVFTAWAPAFGQTVQLPFKTVRSVMLVEVTVDNQPKTLVFDTGAERTMIQSPRNIQQLVTIAFQNRLLGYFPVVLSDFGRKNEMATLHADGILGNDVLSTYGRIVIDYKLHTIELAR